VLWLFNFGDQEAFDFFETIGGTAECGGSNVNAISFNAKYGRNTMKYANNRNGSFCYFIGEQNWANNSFVVKGSMVKRVRNL